MIINRTRIAALGATAALALGGVGAAQAVASPGPQGASTHDHGHKHDSKGHKHDSKGHKHDGKGGKGGKR